MNTFDLKTDITDNQTILIEASAGTGKTYSLAILFLKAILETDDITKILAVTFTEAAVEELKARVRQFIGDALINKEEITQWFPEGFSQAEIKILKKAQAEIDQAPIYTIHGFCMQLLDKYAVEIKHNRLAVLDNNIDKILYPICYDYYKKNIMNLDDADLKKNLTVDNLVAIAKKVIEGREFAMEAISLKDYNNQIKELIEEQNLLEFSISNYEKKLKDEFFSRIEEINENFEKLTTTIQNKCRDYLTDSPNLFMFLNDGEQQFKEKFWGTEFNDIRNKLRKENKAQNTRVAEIKKIIGNKTNRIGVYINNFSEYIDISNSKSKIFEVKSRHNSFTYDDLIQLVEKAVKKNSKLAQKIGQDFPYVFIDEFQDTDKLQYTIFDTCFIENKSTVYLIGDPKQAIYGFRGADIDEYLNAKGKISPNNQYSISTNFRSTMNFIDCQNKLFEELDKNKDFFQKTDIEYQKVNPKPNSKDDRDSDGIYIWKEDFDSEKISQDIANKIEVLKNNGVQLSKIAVLNRKTKYADDIIPKLKGINYVLFKDESVFESTEAEFLQLLLIALNDPKHQTINAALQLSQLNQFDLDNLSAQHQQEVYHKFLEWHKIANEGKIYVAIQKALRYFPLEDNASFYTNVEHIAELLQEQQTQNKWEISSCLNWLNEQIKSSDAQAYNTRVSSDDDAVQIMTIHKSKGLEFEYVFVLGVEDILAPNANYNPFPIYKKDGNNVFNHSQALPGGENPSDERILFDRTAQEETRRLFYVGITRAKHACFIYKFSTNKHFDETYNLLKQTVGTNISSTDDFDATLEYFDANHIGTKSTGSSELTQPEIESKLQNFRNQSFHKMSYSSLSGGHKTFDTQEDKIFPTDFDQFIFKDMGKGAYIGTKLHEIFENMKTGKINNEEYKYLYQRFNKEDADNSEHVRKLVHHVWDADIKFDNSDYAFKISDISSEFVLNEMEFNFKIKDDPRSQFEPASDKIKTFKDCIDTFKKTNTNPEYEVDFRDIRSLNGLMNGFMDVFFQHNNKFYILDWKSNYLGDHVEAYSKDNVRIAMNQSNYHLQYLIYTVAAHKYLSKYLDGYDYDTHFGGVIYLFVRGVRENGNTGIFTHKPERELIEEMAGLMG